MEAFDLSSDVTAAAKEPFGAENTDAAGNARPTQWLAGISFYSAFAWAFDYPLYGAAVWMLGPVWGGILMMALSAPIDLFAVRVYDWSKGDWLALEFLKSVGKPEGNWVRRSVAWIFSKPPVWLQILILSIRFNPFVVTVALRKGSYLYNGMGRREHLIFWSSFIVSHAYWVLMVWLGVMGIEMGWNWLSS